MQVYFTVFELNYTLLLRSVVDQPEVSLKFPADLESKTQGNEGDILHSCIILYF